MREWAYGKLNIGGRACSLGLNRLSRADRGVLAGQGGIIFDDVQVKRIDWPAPAAPTWSVLSGDFDYLDWSVATIEPQPGDPFPVSIREGFYDANYDIEAWLSGDGAGLAFRVKDKLHYGFVTQDLGTPGTYGVWVWRIENGQLMPPVTWGFVPMVQTGSQKHVHVKADDGNVGVWLEDNGGWQCVVSPTGNGHGVLAWPDAGAVGLVSGWLGTADCTLVGIGHDLNDSHTLSLGFGDITDY